MQEIPSTTINQKFCNCGFPIETWMSICRKCYAKQKQKEQEQYQKQLSMARGLKAANLLNINRRFLNNTRLFYNSKEHVYLYKGEVECDSCNNIIRDNIYFKEVWAKKLCCIKIYCLACTEVASKIETDFKETIRVAVVVKEIPSIKEVHPIFIAEPELTTRSNSEGGYMSVYDDAALPKNTERGTKIIDHTKWASFDPDHPKLLDNDDPNALGYKPYKMEEIRYGKDKIIENPDFLKRDTKIKSKNIDKLFEDITSQKVIAQPELKIKYVEYSDQKQIDTKDSQPGDSESISSFDVHKDDKKLLK